jgi:hypothetical protein
MTEKEELEFEMKDEYDFSKARRNPYAGRANAPSTVVYIEPEMHELFPTSEAVNEALRLVAKAGALITKGTAEQRKAS